MGDNITSCPSRNSCLCKRPNLARSFQDEHALSRHMIHGMHAFAGAKLAAERYSLSSCHDDVNADVGTMSHRVGTQVNHN